jgi:hypothetical protein
MDKGGNRGLVIKQGTGEIKSIVPVEAVAAEMIDTGSKRHPTTLATGRGDKRQTGEANRTEKRGPGMFQSPPAAQTQRGKQQIL